MDCSPLGSSVHGIFPARVLEWGAILYYFKIKNCVVIFSNLEKAMAPHSSTLAGKIPWTEEPGGLLSMGLHRVGHD